MCEVEDSGPAVGALTDGEDNHVESSRLGKVDDLGGATVPSIYRRRDPKATTVSGERRVELLCQLGEWRRLSIKTHMPAIEEAHLLVL